MKKKDREKLIKIFKSKTEKELMELRTFLIKYKRTDIEQIDLIDSEITRRFTK